jgi:hypothetical protein
VHEGGFSVQMNPNGQPEFRDPNDKTLPYAPEMRFRGNVFRRFRGSILEDGNKKPGRSLLITALLNRT